MPDEFRVGFTQDFIAADGRIGIGDIGLGFLEGRRGVTYDFLPRPTVVLSPDDVAGYDAIGVLAPKITEETLAGNDRLTVLARYGVGYDSVDIAACTRHGIAVTITPDGVRRPMASSIITFVLALSHRLLEQDKANRGGEGWSRKLELMGYGVTGKRLGMIGLGNIGSEAVRLLKPFGMDVVSYDPYLDPARAAALDVHLVSLDDLLETSDYVVVMCALTPETRGMINADRIAKMKPTAFLINVARGPIVDQVALYDALVGGKIRGAALDVYREEPVDPSEPLLTLENVIVTPHAIGWTDEWATLTGESAMNGVLAVARGEVPRFIVNKEVVENRQFLAKLAGYRERNLAQ